MTYDEAAIALHAADPARDYIFVSHGITRELHKSLSKEIETKGKHKKATLFLNTYGGDPDGAFRIARALRHYYPEGLRIAIPHWCKSAGTLIAMVADELAIGDFGELGPLDIQVYKGSELQERSSGLDITEAMGAVTEHIKESFHLVLKETRNLGLSTKLSAEFAAQVSAAIAEPLFSQLDPLRFGELQRLTRVAEEYGQRLNAYGRNLKPGALQNLIHNYPSHSFVIDRKEAKELFARVSPLSDAERDFCETVWHCISEQVAIACIIQPPQQDSTTGTNDEQPQAPSTEPTVGTGADANPAEQSGDTEPSAESLRVRANRPRRAQGNPFALAK